MSDMIAKAGRWLARLLLPLAVSGAIAMPAFAAEPPTTIIVFDGSGSMWGKLDKDTKFAGAREALRRALPKMGATSLVGLAAFGHRRKGDCSDTEVMLAPEPLDTARIMAPLEKFNPKGKGPLSAALKEAAAALGKSAGATSLILIHDDPDNCSQDPCAVTEDLNKANPKLTIHVIGIGLSKPDFQRMSCVPRLTGGRHFDAQDLPGLTSAVEDALKLASLDAKPLAPAPTAGPSPATPPAAVAAPTPPVEDNGPPGLKLSSTLGRGGPAIIVPLTWQVRKAADAVGAPPVAVVRTPTLDIELPPGAYVVEVQQGLIKASETFEVKAKGATRAIVAIQAGAVRITAMLQKGMAPLEQAVFTIADIPSGASPSRTVWSGGADAPPVFLPVGTWRIGAELDRARADRQVQVTAGAMIDVGLTLGAGRLRARATDRDGGTSLDNVTFRITEDDADSPDGRREVARSAATEPDFTLTAGTYYLSARQGSAEVRERVLVNAGDDVSRTLLLPIGRLSLQSRLAGSTASLDGNVGYRIERLDSRQEPIRVSASTPRIELPAGRYRVESELGRQNARIVREIDIRQGAQTSLSFEHVAANVQLKLAGTTRLSAGEVAWDVRDAQDRSIWQTLQAEPRAFLAAGRYKILVESRDRRGRAEIEVKGGETRIVELNIE